MLRSCGAFFAYPIKETIIRLQIEKTYLHGTIVPCLKSGRGNLVFASVITAIASFISTNIDDLFVLMLFYAQAETSKEKGHIIIGQSLGIGTLVLISLIGAFVLHFIPGSYVGFLGLIPIALGIQAWRSHQKKSGSQDDWAKESASSDANGPDSLILRVMLVSIANGADNIGVYVPLFSGYSMAQILVVLLVFAVMITMWCMLAQNLLLLPALKAWIQQRRDIIVPVVFVALGFYIFFESGLIG